MGRALQIFRQDLGSRSRQTAPPGQHRLLRGRNREGRGCVANVGNSHDQPCLGRKPHQRPKGS
ncbi:hypothetical protein AKJ09_02091 [Labilithrix luteola]|uniref:Uncharacterized protein n=1 Tax=Labilithrix luteola TaxID=1391654 RepID=A0A0K1PPI6_9BACT|nr:hypothetical protein AKJ09_02091 [Labilithrix luteola]